MEKIKGHGKWLIIVNPNAGSRKGQKDWPGIADLLNENDIHYEAKFTEKRGHATEICMKGIRDGYRKLVVVGGDGTLNEVANGILMQDVCKKDETTLGMIPLGTGNDWGKMYGLPKKYEHAVSMLRKGHDIFQDVGLVRYYDNGTHRERYFINVSGMGYDALVALKTNRMKDKGRGSTLSYLLNIFTGLFQYRNTYFDIQLDGKKVFSGKVLSMNLGIGKYNGGGMMQVPDAIPDDGLLDITVIKAISKFSIVRHVSKLYDGSFVNLKFVNQYRGRTCTIVSRPPGSALLEADGESLGHSPLEFSVLPRALRVIVPEQKVWP
jgi:YegS/Rv2252/BmrU family lipid kinase